MEEILKEIAEGLAVRIKKVFSGEITDPKEIDGWLDEKLTAFEKKTKEDFLKRILPEDYCDNGWSSCRDEVIKNANKEGISI